MRTDPSPAIRASYLAFAPLLLIGVALLQQYRAHVQNLTPWKGGGFGMFSTVDTTGARFFRLRVVTDEGSFPATLPRNLRPRIRKVRAMPCQQDLQVMAHGLARETWVPSDYHKKDRSSANADRIRIRVKGRNEPEPKGRDRLPVRAIQLELWKYEFNRNTGTVRARLWFSARAPRDAR